MEIAATPHLSNNVSRPVRAEHDTNNSNAATTATAVSAATTTTAVSAVTTTTTTKRQNCAQDCDTTGGKNNTLTAY